MTLFQKIKGFFGKKPKVLTKEQLQGHIDFALKDAAELYNCRIDELEYKVGKNQAIQVRKKKI
jgi:hypothetical protein